MLSTKISNGNPTKWQCTFALCLETAVGEVSAITIIKKDTHSKTISTTDKSPRHKVIGGNEVMPLSLYIN